MGSHNRWSLTDSDRVAITKNGESYEEFPIHDGLVDFDKSDCKFVAASNAHKDKPPILQATDSKWWGWKDSLAEAGITVHFLCSKYAEAKCAERWGHDRWLLQVSLHTAFGNTGWR